MFNRADFSLRPLRQADRELLLRWRNSDRVRENMYTEYLVGEAEHNVWFAKTLNYPAAFSPNTFVAHAEPFIRLLRVF